MPEMTRVERAAWNVTRNQASWGHVRKAAAAVEIETHRAIADRLEGMGCPRSIVWAVRGWSDDLADEPYVVLRRRRQLAGLSQRAIADRLGVDHSTVCGWELGQHRMSDEQIQRYDAVLAEVSDAA